MSYSVVIPSKNIGNLTACVSALRACGETCRVIVVDDGLPLGGIWGERCVSIRDPANRSTLSGWVFPSGNLGRPRPIKSWHTSNGLSK